MAVTSQNSALSAFEISLYKVYCIAAYNSALSYLQLKIAIATRLLEIRIPVA